MSELNKSGKLALFLVLFLSIGLIVGITAWGAADNALQVQNGKLKISGMYGESIPLAKIQSVTLIERKPQISRRTNGFGLGPWKKGNFSNAKGEEFKLFVNTRELPWILITKKNGQKIYYASARKSNSILFEELVQTMPYK